MCVLEADGAEGGGQEDARRAEAGVGRRTADLQEHSQRSSVLLLGTFESFGKFRSLAWIGAWLKQY